MEIRELMTPNVITVEPASSAALASRLLSRYNIGALPVCSPQGALRGVVTDRDIVLRCVAAEEDPAQTQVKDIMTRRPASAEPGMDCLAAAQLMARHQIRRLPVVEKGKVVGMVSLGDLARCRGLDMEAAQALSEISGNIIHR